MAKGLKDFIEKMGWKIRYVPREVIGDYNACYRVSYNGIMVNPPAADQLGIPLGEIWLLEDLRAYEDYVLFHEIREIIHRYEGLGVEEAHLMARVDEALRFCGDPVWLEYFEDYPDYTVPRQCLEELCSRINEGLNDPRALYNVLQSCIRHVKRSPGDV